VSFQSFLPSASAVTYGGRGCASVRSSDVLTSDWRAAFSPQPTAAMAAASVKAIAQHADLFSIQLPQGRPHHAASPADGCRSKGDAVRAMRPNPPFAVLCERSVALVPGV
jgi:hypothetical protein